MTFKELDKLSSTNGKIKRVLFIRDMETGNDIEIDIVYNSGKVRTVNSYYDLPLTAIRFLSMANNFKAWHTDTRVYIAHYAI